MAASGERRMIFDVRGRRKHVIRVVYAILAVLMGASLFLTVGPFNISELIGNGGSAQSSGEVLEEQAQRIERRLAKEPDNEALLLSLTRAKIIAGESIYREQLTSETERPPLPASAKADYEAAAAAWHRYLKQAGSEPSATVAEMVGRAYVGLAESSVRTIGETEENLRRAAAAQQLAAAQRPTLGSLSTLAIYEYFANDFAAGDRAAKEATAKAGSQAKAVETQLAAYRKRGKQWEKQRKKIAKEQRKTGKEKLENPLGGLSGSTSPLTP